MPTYALEILTPSGKHDEGDSITISNFPATLGRSSRCTVQFGEEDQTVSREHATIEVIGDEVFIINHSRTNATLVNGQTVKRKYYLSDGDVIQLSTEGPKLRFAEVDSVTANIGSNPIQGKNKQAGRNNKKTVISIAAVIFGLCLVTGALYYSNLSTPYEDKIREADKHYQLGEYEEALSDYLIALTHKGDPGYPSRQITRLNGLLYKQHIDVADAQFDNGNYEKAIAGYKRALEYKEGEEYALQRIRESEESLSFSYYNDFSREDSKFTNYKNEFVAWNYEGGYFKVVSYNDSYTYTPEANFARLQDAEQFEFSVRMKHVSGSDNYPFGLIFAGAPKHYNLFGITCVGNRKEIGRYEQSLENLWQTEVTEDTQVNENGAWNNLKVVYNGSQFIYYLNGSEVERRQAEIVGQNFGFYVDGRAGTVQFDDVSLKATF